MVLKGVERIIHYNSLFQSILYTTSSSNKSLIYIKFPAQFLKWKTAFTMVVDFVVRTTSALLSVLKLFSGEFHRVFTCVYIVFRPKFRTVLWVFTRYLSRIQKWNPPRTITAVLPSPFYCVPPFQKLFARYDKHRSPFFGIPTCYIVKDETMCNGARFKW